ncbi:hypothetical protein D4764_13G0009830 [Takifugu flavidus]|uniref:Reverse transcriptase domain-containing protein n=1 Tax=Takifugu flavidus TaxID=433684 RepID=A0A5C6PCA8_9TELE|nr:hypothetical protein D4764_13G0009830 [Takifugu flavidus]
MTISPVALTPINTKCLEQLVLAQLKSCSPPNLDPHQFAYRKNRSTEDAPQHCTLSSHTWTIKTHTPKMLFIDFSSALNTSLHGSNTIIKFADDTTVIGHIKDNDESAYREEVDRLATWRKTDIHPPIHINGAAVEGVSSFKFLGSTSHRTSPGRLTAPVDILVNFLSLHHESILTRYYGLVWELLCLRPEGTAEVVKTAQRIAGAPLPSIEDIYRRRCHRRAKVSKDSCPPPWTVHPHALWEVATGAAGQKNHPLLSPC